MRAALLIDRVRTARQNNSLGGEVKLGNLLSAREHLRVDVELSETSSDPISAMVS